MGYEHISFKDGFVAIQYNGLSTRKSENVVIDGEHFTVGILQTDDVTLAVYRKSNKYHLSTPYGERNDKE